MKRIIVALAAFAIFAVASHAQSAPQADVAVGYSYFRMGGSGGINLNGVSGSAAYNVNNWVGVVGDLGVYHGSPAGVGFTNVTYTFGPRFTYREAGRVVPFAQALFGGAHLSALSSSSNPFAYGFGGGADIAMNSSGSITLRPQVDYFGLRSNGNTANCTRISVGVIYHFGQK